MFHAIRKTVGALLLTGLFTASTQAGMVLFTYDAATGDLVDAATGLVFADITFGDPNVNTTFSSANLNGGAAALQGNFFFVPRVSGSDVIDELTYNITFQDPTYSIDFATWGSGGITPTAGQDLSLIHI